MGSLSPRTLKDQCASWLGPTLACDKEISVFKLRRIICSMGHQTLRAFRNVIDHDHANLD